MWFVLLKIFRFGYSETKKHRAKKQQQQQPPYPYPYPYYAGQEDPTRGPGPGPGTGASPYPNHYYYPANQSSSKTGGGGGGAQSKREQARYLVTCALRVLQLAMGLAVIGLYAQEINAARAAASGTSGTAHRPARCVLAETTGVLACMTATACLGLEVWWKKRGREGLGRRARVQMPLFAWEGLLVVLWLVVFGVFGAVYLGARHRDKESSAGADAGAGADVLDEGIRLVRMRRAVRVDLVNVLLWAASATWSGLRWWRGKSAAAAAAANSGSDVAAGAGAGAGEEKEMV